MTAAFPYGTFAVNVAGCLAIGLVYGFAERFDWFSADLQALSSDGILRRIYDILIFAYENIELLAG